MLKGGKLLAERTTSGKHTNWVNNKLQTFHNAAVLRGRELSEAPSSAASTLNRDGTSSIPLEASPMVLGAGNDKNKTSVSFRPDFKNGKDRFVYFDDEGKLLLLSDNAIRGLGMGRGNEAEEALEGLRSSRAGSPLLQPFGPKSTKSLMAERSAMRSQAIQEKLHVTARPIAASSDEAALLSGPQSSSDTPQIEGGGTTATTTCDGGTSAAADVPSVTDSASESTLQQQARRPGAIRIADGIAEGISPAAAIAHAKEASKELGYDRTERMEHEELAFQLLQHAHDREYIHNLFSIDSQGNPTEGDFAPPPLNTRNTSRSAHQTRRIGAADTSQGTTSGKESEGGEQAAEDNKENREEGDPSDETTSKKVSEDEQEEEDPRVTVEHEFARASAYRRERATSRNSANARRKPLTYEKALGMSGNRIVIELAKNMIQAKDEIYDSRAMGWLGSPERKTYGETAANAGRFASKIRNTYFAPSERAGMMRGEKFDSGGVDAKRMEAFGEKAKKLGEFMTGDQSSAGGKASQKGGGLSGGVSGDPFGATGSFSSHQGGRLDDGEQWANTAAGGRRGNAPPREKPFAMQQERDDEEGMSSHTRRAAKFQSYRQELNQLQQSRIQTTEHEELVEDALKYLEGYIDFAPVRRGVQRAQNMYYEQQAHIHPQKGGTTLDMDGAQGTELLLPRSALQGRLVGLLFFDDSEHSLKNLARFGHFIHEQRHVMDAEHKRALNLKTIERDLINRRTLPIKHNNTWFGKRHAAKLTDMTVRIEEEARHGKTNNGDIVFLGIPHGGMSDQHARDLLRSQGLGYIPNHMGSSLVTRDAGFGSSLLFRYPHLYIIDGTTGKVITKHGISHLMRHPHTSLREWSTSRDCLMFDVDAESRKAKKKWETPDDPNAGSSWKRTFYEKGASSGAADDALGLGSVNKANRAAREAAEEATAAAKLLGNTKELANQASSSFKEWADSRLTWMKTYAMAAGDPPLFDIVASTIGLNAPMPISSFERRLFNEPELSQEDTLDSMIAEEERLAKEQDDSPENKKTAPASTDHFSQPSS